MYHSEKLAKGLFGVWIATFVLIMIYNIYQGIMEETGPFYLVCDGKLIVSTNTKQPLLRILYQGYAEISGEIKTYHIRQYNQCVVTRKNPGETR